MASAAARGKRPATVAARAVTLGKRRHTSNDSNDWDAGGSDWGWYQSAKLRRDVISISSSDNGSDREWGIKDDDTYTVRCRRASAWVSPHACTLVTIPTARGDHVSEADRSAVEPRVAAGCAPVLRAAAASRAAPATPDAIHRSKLVALEYYILKAAADPHALGLPVRDGRRLFLGDWAIDVQGKQRPTGVWDWEFIVSYEGLRHSVVASMKSVARAICGPAGKMSAKSLGASSASTAASRAAANVSGASDAAASSTAGTRTATDVPPEPLYSCQVCTEEFSIDSLNDCTNEEVFHALCDHCAVQTLRHTHKVVVLRCARSHQSSHTRWTNAWYFPPVRLAVCVVRNEMHHRRMQRSLLTRTVHGLAPFRRREDQRV